MDIIVVEPSLLKQKILFSYFRCNRYMLCWLWTELVYKNNQSKNYILKEGHLLFILTSYHSVFV